MYNTKLKKIKQISIAVCFFVSMLAQARAENMNICQLLNSEIERITNDLNSPDLALQKSMAYGQTYPGGNGATVLMQIKAQENSMRNRIFELNNQKIQNHCN